MSLSILQPALFAVIAVSVVALIVLTILNLKVKSRAPHAKHLAKKTPPTVVAARVIGVVGIVAMLALAATGLLVQAACDHGAYALGDATVSETVEHIRKSPVDQSDQLPDDPTDMVVYMYRFTCPDCEDVHEELMTWLDGCGKPYLCVSSRSEKGKVLKETLSVTEVPSVIYFDGDGKSHMQIVYKRNENGDAVIDTEALAYIERAMANGSSR